ncbi:hypothetical protein [Alkalibaculum bacchi]|uniref:hypothetical protein n=1 Tax=Alkalibaculum bacchi TaxID=645887 RepID=UPI0026F2228E|nr:hypothetical protein [Alkalibaculum bacchi]
MMKIGKILMIIVALMLVLLIVGIPVGNDMIALSVSKRLRNTPLPEDTEIIDYTSKAGKLVGSGNGMQYLGAILVKSQLTREALDNYYSKYRENDWSYLVSEQKSSQIKFIEHGYLEFDSLKDTVDFNGYYVVYSWGNNNSLLDFDLRGH